MQCSPHLVLLNIFRTSEKEKGNGFNKRGAQMNATRATDWGTNCGNEAPNLGHKLKRRGINMMHKSEQPVLKNGAQIGASWTKKWCTNLDTLGGPLCYKSGQTGSKIGAHVCAKLLQKFDHD